VDELVVLLGRSLAQLHQPPGPVEEVDGESPLLLWCQVGHYEGRSESRSTSGA
jgi:hypothetical protein